MSTSAVTISINLVDTNSAAVIGKTQAAITGLGAAGTAASAQLAGVTTDLGRVAEAATRASGQLISMGKGWTSSGVTGMTGGFKVVSAATEKMENDVRGASRTVIGASREMGIGISRYFAAEIIDKFPGLITIVKSLGTAFFALGAIEIGAHLVEGLVGVYDKFFDVNKAVEEYQKKAAAAAQEKLFDIASLETSISLLAQANRQVDELAAKKKDARPENKLGAVTQLSGGSESSGMMVGDTNAYNVHDSVQQAENLLQVQKAAERQGTLEHEQRLAQIKLEQNSSLQGYAKRADEERTANKLAAEGVRYQQEQEEWLQKQINAYRELLLAQGKFVEAEKYVSRQIIPGDYGDVGRGGRTSAGTSAAITAEQEAAKRKREGDAEQARRERDQEIAMHDEAVNAGLRGEALYQAQRAEAIAAIERKFHESEISKQTMIAETADVNLKFDNARLMRLKEEEEQLRHTQAEAQLSGLTGIARIQAETEERKRQVRYQGSLKGPEYEQTIMPGMIAAADLTGENKITESTKEYYARLQQMNDEWDTAQLQGYARIEAETVHHLDTLKKDFEKEFPGKNINTDEKSQATMINAWTNADRERQKLHQETMLSLQKEESDAARALMAPWAAAQQQILEQYSERIQKANMEYQATMRYAKLSAEGRKMAEDDYQAKVQAARQLEAAQMQKAAQQMRDELAGKLSSFFQDPMKFMEKQAESIMMKIIANWVMQLGDFQHNPVLQVMFGMGKNMPAPGASSHPSGLAKLMGAGGSSKLPSTAETQLSYAGSTLGTAGSVLITAAGDLTAAAATIGRGGFGGAGWPGGRTSGGSGFGGGSGSGGAFDIPLGTAGSVASLGGSPAGATGAGRFDLPLGMSGTASALGSRGNDYGAMLAGGGQTLKLGTTLASDFSKHGAAGTTMSGIGPVANGEEYAKLLSNEGGGSGNYMKQFSGVVSGGLAMFGALEGAYQKGSEIMGTIGGAASGAAIGSAFMPGIGTAVGAAAGAIAGFTAGMFGAEARRKAAREYLINTVEPKMHSAMQKYYDGTESYDQAQHELSALQASEKGNFGKWGKQGSQIWGTDGIQVFSVSAALLLDAEKAGRGEVPRGTSEFHSGGFVAGFGAGDLGNGEGLAKLRRGEYVVDANTTAAYRPALEALTHSSRTMPLHSANNGGGVHLHVHALDLKDFRGYLRGGGAQEVQAALNSYSGEYAGMADNA